MLALLFLMEGPYILGIARSFKVFIMWTVEELEKRVANLAQQVEQSSANHHVLLGAKMSMEGLLMEAKNAAAATTPLADEAEFEASTD